MEKQLKELKNRLKEIDDLTSSANVLHWDRNTHMPPSGAAARGRQIATLQRLSHEKFVDSATGRLLDQLAPAMKEYAYDSYEASLVRITRRDYEKAIKVPAAFQTEFYTHASEGYEAWVKARPENNFPALLPYLEKTLAYSRQYADFFPGYDNIADPLIDRSDYGMKAKSIRTLFGQLREQLVPLVKSISEHPPIDDTCLRAHFPEDEQLAFGKKVIEQFGFDFKRGRQDKTPHPFAIKISIDDVRITTRVREDFFGEALFSTLHEAGHGLYSLGINKEFEGSPLAKGFSSGVHESQSRLWENLVGHSSPFWEHYYPQLQKEFPEQFEHISLDTFYRAINKVSPSLIRTDADEVTYNLHVMIRFDLELSLLEGSLSLNDLPEAWHARYESDLGLSAPDDVDGVLQDVHWYAGFIGGSFQGYTLGNIIGSLFFDQAIKAHPEIESDIGRGQFGVLHNWLKENIYQHGRKYTTDELVKRISGAPMTIEPYIRYLQTKYGQIYDLSLKQS